ncbi:MAG TPA: DUF6668 family protein [Kineosporiaceae bacterium]|nr:DUF6668 family protein [Kineosporiaceae bacterium]
MWRRSQLPEPHPFLRSLHGDSPEPVPAADDDSSWVTGAQIPIGLPVGPGEGLPRRQLGEAVQTAFLWVVGTHGGAGATTVTSLLQELAGDSRLRIAHGVQESPGQWPCGPGANLAATTLLVARTHGRGLAAATSAARQWASGALSGIKLVGLVLVHDGPRLSREQRAEVQRVSALTPRCWQVGWQEPWRGLVAPALTDTPRDVRRALASVITQAHDVAAGVVTSKGKQQ